MNLVKRCKQCREYFPSKPLSPNPLCSKKECQEYSDRCLNTIKQYRFIPFDYLDLYDMDSPLKNRATEYERVCRMCGAPLHNEKGEYCYRTRYCHNPCTSYNLMERITWNVVSKSYTASITTKYKHKIQAFLDKDYIAKGYDVYLYDFVVCEECGRICTSSGSGIPNYLLRKYEFNRIPHINIHHIQPVHSLTWENIHLLWDKRNLIALCLDCHNKQDHHLSKFKNDLRDNYKSITEFL